MQDNSQNQGESWDLTSTFEKINNFTLKYAGLFGMPFYIFFAQSAHKEMLLNSDAGLLDAAGNFYGSVVDATVNSFIPGSTFVLSEIFNTAASLATDFVIPGAGAVIQGLMELSNG